GGTGKTGRRVVQRLTAQGGPVRIGSRSGGLPFDWEDPATWAPALTGVTAAYVSYYPDLAAPGAAEAVGSFAEIAVNSGTRRLVLLSGRGEDEAVACEKALADSGSDWTVLRCSWFNQNFSEGYLLEPVLSGHVALPAGPAGRGSPTTPRPPPAWRRPPPPRPAPRGGFMGCPPRVCPLSPPRPRSPPPPPPPPWFPRRYRRPTTPRPWRPRAFPPTSSS